MLMYWLWRDWCMKKEHSFEPIYNSSCRVLILGSLPSVKSTEQGFYYSHPRNRFWPLMARLLGCPLPVNIAERTQLLLENKLALWDVVKLCEIEGSADASISNAEPNNIERILAEAPIEAIYANGSKAASLYNRLLLKKTGRPIIYLPSTSPANAAWSMERLAEAWKIIVE